jgi:hypothetical protein
LSKEDTAVEQVEIVNKKIKEMGYRSLRDYIGQRAHYTLSQMADELGMPVASFREVHAEIIQEIVEHESS